MDGAEQQQQIIDGEPLIKAATELKEQGNSQVKAKKYNEAVLLYERGIAVLDKADGHPMLRDEVEAMIRLKATLFANTAQCLLSLELWRRAVAAASSAVALDAGHEKALYRRSLGNECLQRFQEALDDMLLLQGLEQCSMAKDQVQSRIAALKAKIEALEREKAAESSDDEVDSSLVRMKERFDEVVEKYDLKQGNAAEEVAEWLVSGEWVMTTTRVAQRWKMEPEDAEDFLRWIAKGLEFKAQNAEAAGLAAAQSPALDEGSLLGV